MMVLAAKPTTLAAVRGAGVHLATFDEGAALRLVVVLMPHPEEGGEPGMVWAVQTALPDGRFDSVMADLEDEADWANQDRVRALMALTKEEEAELDRMARAAAVGFARGSAGDA
ncbi:hypothetical protein LVJ94_34790 [Pendulispora rubella]|uniref:Uncharacterized protein n=1 Tax=Pendulispora rubella TaxID=2741070 RepID=A0ABZ2KWB5_9BACT